MQKKKTGELFGFCCESIAIIKGANSIRRKKLKEIGINIGLLFQIADDLIDHRGNLKRVGKKTKKDISLQNYLIHLSHILIFFPMNKNLIGPPIETL